MPQHHTNYVVYLMTAWTFNSSRIVCGMHKHTIQRRGPWGLSVVTSGSEAYEASHKRACPLRLIYGADRVCLGSTKAHTPSVQLTLVSTSTATATGPGPGSWGYGRGQRKATQKQQKAGREASWLKEVGKVKRVEKSEKWVTRPRGGEVKSKNNLVKFVLEQKQMIGVTVEWNRKGQNHVCWMLTSQQPCSKVMSARIGK